MSSGCILGFASSEWKSVSGAWYDTHIGGIACWPEGFCIDIPPCPICRRDRTLVLQAYAPHYKHSQREIYLYACNYIQCSTQSESWFAVRVTNVEKVSNNEGQNSIPSTRPGNNVFGEERQSIKWDSDSDSDTSVSASEALVQELESLSLALTQNETKKVGLAGKQANKKAATRSSVVAQLSTNSAKQPKSTPLASFYVEVDNEPALEHRNKDKEQVSRLLSKYNEDESLRSKRGIQEQWADEKDEEDKPEALSLEQFNERIARAPEQILRYDFGGEPLWPRYPPPQIKSDTCECGMPMIFEVQLLGSCLHYLRPEESLPPEQKEAGMNFASIAIYTCAGDCEKTKPIAENASFKAFGQQICVQQEDW